MPRFGVSRVRVPAVLCVSAVNVAAAVTSFAVAVQHRGASDLAVSLTYQLFTLVGAMLVIRRPRHPIGALFMLAGAGAAWQGLAEAWVERAAARHEVTGMLVHLAAWLQSWLWVPTLVVPVVFVILLFPDGKPASPRWAKVVWLGVAGLAMVVLPLAGVGLTLPTQALIDGNPHLAGWQQALFVFTYIGILCCLGCGVAGLVGLFRRYRRGDATTRQQVKLVLFAAGLAIAGDVLGSFGPDLQNVLEPLGTALIAASVAVAVLRYRLFDIDRVISRTLAYLLLTVTLAGVYLACIALVTRGTGATSQVGVAASTLASAAAFHPLRRRIQAAVDRRFNRQRYDAERTVDALRTHLRQDVHLDTVVAELLRTVGHAVEPASISVWVAAAPK